MAEGLCVEPFEEPEPEEPVDRIDRGNCEYGLSDDGTIVLTRRGPPMFGEPERTQEERDQEMASSPHARSHHSTAQVAPHEHMDLEGAWATWMRKDSILITKEIDPTADGPRQTEKPYGLTERSGNAVPQGVLYDKGSYWGIISES